jgi:large subunit ribosomal protein L15
MKHQDLTVRTRQDRRRVGRGISAGGGKTAGRGTKGQNSRSGGQRNPGFEGGQTTLFQRLPKLKGFRSKRPKNQIIHTSTLDGIDPKQPITIDYLYEAGLVHSSRIVTKLLFDVPPKQAHKVELPVASEKARQALQEAGGTFTATPIKPLEKTSTKRTTTRQA